jgi:hypothetical protein
MRIKVLGTSPEAQGCDSAQSDTERSVSNVHHHHRVCHACTRQTEDEIQNSDRRCGRTGKAFLGLFVSFA